MDPESVWIAFTCHYPFPGGEPATLDSFFQQGKVSMVGYWRGITPRIGSTPWQYHCRREGHGQGSVVPEEPGGVPSLMVKIQVNQLKSDIDTGAETMRM